MPDFFSLPVPLGLYLAALLVSIAAVAVQSSVGFGFAVVCVPILVQLDPRLAPVPQLLMLAPLVLWMAWRERQALKLSEVGWILVGRLPGAALGLWLWKVADQRTLDLLIGGCVLAAVATMGLRRSDRPLPRTPLTKLVAGTISGAMALVSSIGGPPLALLYAGTPGPIMRANLASIFAFGMMISAGTRLAAGELGWGDVHIALWLGPAVPVGILLARWKVGELAPATLRRAVLVLASASALTLLGRTLLAG